MVTNPFIGIWVLCDTFVGTSTHQPALKHISQGFAEASRKFADQRFGALAFERAQRHGDMQVASPEHPEAPPDRLSKYIKMSQEKGHKGKSIGRARSWRRLECPAAVIERKSLENATAPLNTRP